MAASSYAFDSSTIPEELKRNIKTPLKQCPYCNTKKPYMEQITPQMYMKKGVSHYSEKYDVLWYFYQCNVCNNCVTIFATQNIGNDEFYVFHYYPSPDNIFLEHEAIPENIRADLQEAIDSAPSASIMMTTRALDMMLVDKGKYDDKMTYNDKIEKALEEGFITQDISEWAHKIRRTSNSIRHKNGNDRPTPEEAQQALKFAQTLAEIFYIYPSLIPKEKNEEEAKNDEKAKT